MCCRYVCTRGPVLHTCVLCAAGVCARALYYTLVVFSVLRVFTVLQVCPYEALYDTHCRQYVQCVRCVQRSVGLSIRGSVLHSSWTVCSVCSNMFSALQVCPHRVLYYTLVADMTAAYHARPPPRPIHWLSRQSMYVTCWGAPCPAAL